MDFAIDFQWLVIGIIAVVTILTIPKIARNMTLNSTKSQRKLQQLDNEYIEELEAQLKSAKTSLSNKERGPVLQDGAIEELIPELVGDLSSFVPKKLQFLFQDKELQSAIIKKVMENPEKYKGPITKFIKKTVSKDSTTSPEQEVTNGL